MQSPFVGIEYHSFMDELVDLLGAFPCDRSRQEGELVALRLEDLERRARLQGAAAETLAAIRGARVLLELPPRLFS